MSGIVEPTEGVRGLLELLADGLAQVLESMTDKRPEVLWEPIAGKLADLDPGADAEMVWWQQKFQILSQPALWVGVPRATWEELGGRTLRAAGLEEVELADARNTWLEILNQALGSTARGMGARLGQEVTCAEGVEQAPSPESDRWFRIVLRYDSALPPILVMPGGNLTERLDRASASTSEAHSDGAHEGDSPERLAAGANRTMELLLDVELPVSLSFGRSQIPLKDVLKLTTGSIVELNRGVAEPVDVLVNQCLIARGEVVVIDGNYAVRIQQIVSAQERLRSVR